MMISNRFQLRLKLCNRNMNKLKSFRLKQSEYKFLNELFVDLLKSAYLALLIYFLFFIAFYLFINFNYLNDPSQSNTCFSNSKHKIKNSTETRDLARLASTIDSVLNKGQNENRKVFLCYRSLYYLLKQESNDYENQNVLDLCLYDTDLSLTNILHNLKYQFGNSKIESNLKEYLRNDSNFENYFSYDFDHIFGIFNFKYRRAQIYIYLFVNSPETKLEFESIQRYGLLYTQYGNLIDFFYKQSYPSGIGTLKQSINFIIKLPIYMIDEMNFKVKIVNNYFWLPVDPINSLMHFYPSLWWRGNNTSSDGNKDLKFNCNS